MRIVCTLDGQDYSEGRILELSHFDEGLIRITFGNDNIIVDANDLIEAAIRVKVD